MLLCVCNSHFLWLTLIASAWRSINTTKVKASTFFAHWHFLFDWGKPIKCSKKVVCWHTNKCSQKHEHFWAFTQHVGLLYAHTNFVKNCWKHIHLSNTNSVRRQYATGDVHWISSGGALSHTYKFCLFKNSKVIFLDTLNNRAVRWYTFTQWRNWRGTGVRTASLASQIKNRATT